MKKIVFFILLIIMSNCCAFAEIKATIDPLDIGVGARALGMGKAYVAVADDASCVFLNPAGLSLVKNWGVNTMYSSVLSEISYNAISAYRSSSSEGIGIGFIGANIGGDIITSYRDPVTNRIIPLSTVAAGYSSNVLMVSYGVLLGKYINIPYVDRTSFGFSFKAFYQRLKATEESSASGYDIDIGLLYPVNKWLKLGFYAQNILPVSSGGVLRWDSGAQESIPANYKIGLNSKVLGKDSIWESYSQDLFYNLDIEGSFLRNRPYIYHTGIEWWPYDYLAFRFGLDQDVYAKDSTNGVDNNLTFGLGLWYGDWGFDYSYHQYGPLSDNLTHYFAISYGYPKERAAEVTVEAEKPKPAPVTKPSEYIKFTGPSDRSVVYGDSVTIGGEIIDSAVAFIGVNGQKVEIIKQQINQKSYFSQNVPVPSFGKFMVKVKCLDDKGELIKEYAIRLLRLPSFTDVPEGYWAREKIGLLSMLNIFGGYPDRTFKPDKTINRAELTTLLSRAKGFISKEGADTIFTDVPRSNWASFYIKTGVDLGLVTGYPDKTFRPAKSVNKAEGVTILSRFAGLKEPDTISEGPFPDVPGRHWAAKSVTAAKSAGMLVYLTGKSFGPAGEMTRAEAAEILSQTQFVKERSTDLYDWEKGF